MLAVTLSMLTGCRGQAEPTVRGPLDVVVSFPVAATPAAPTPTRPRPTPTAVGTATPKPTASPTPAATLSADNAPPTDAPERATDTPPTASEPTPTISSDAREAMLALHNSARATRGLALYRPSDLLAKAAQIQARNMASLPQQTLVNPGPLGHTGPLLSGPAQRVAGVGYPASSASENWAYQFSTADAFDYWLTDPFRSPHVLSAVFTEIGFGIAPHP